MLEELLNKLIEKGRVPFGEKEIKNIKILKTKDKRWNFVCQIPGGISKHCTRRELVSKESNLWQFCVENEMVKEQVLGWEEYHWAKCTADNELREHYSTYSLEYEYRLIESALKNEDELEQFLLDNIKIDE